MLDTKIDYAVENGPDEFFPVIEFTAHARCDECGSRAYHSAHKENAASELLFCFHHIKIQRDKLKQDGWTITDDGEGIARDLFPKKFQDMED